VSDLISRFVLLLSLVALVIGGVGIINTMLVAVIAAVRDRRLKTLGLQVEPSPSCSCRGRLYGHTRRPARTRLGTSERRGAQHGEAGVGVAAAWHLYGEPRAGLVLGVVITGMFSLMPTLVAGQVRPGLGAPPEHSAGRAGCLPTLLI